MLHAIPHVMRTSFGVYEAWNEVIRIDEDMGAAGGVESFFKENQNQRLDLNQKQSNMVS